MKKTIAALTLALAIAGSPATVMTQSSHAASACPSGSTIEFVNGADRVLGSGSCESPGTSSDGSSGTPTVFDPEYGRWSQQQFIDCQNEAQSLGEDVAEFCGSNGAAPTVTPGVVQQAFTSIPLPSARLSIQPPNGRTLVNFDTNFFTERPAFTRVVTLLGQRITLRIEPASFTWHFEPGDSRSTTTPGARYPRLLVTHNYVKEGGYRPRVDTTYTATFRVGGGPWRPVPGSVTIAGPTVALEAVEAQPVLTAP